MSRSSYEIDPQEVAFGLLAEICKTDESGLTAMYEVLDEYQCHSKRKKRGGYRIIAEPHSLVKQAQRNILQWLYLLQKRSAYYVARPTEKPKVYYQGIFTVGLHPAIHGCVPEGSVARAARSHLNNPLFVLKVDLQDAFGSVKESVVARVLQDILIEECTSYFLVYRHRFLLGKAAFRNRYSVEESEERRLPKNESKFLYQKYPLFSSKRFLFFRGLVRWEVRRTRSFEETVLPEIAACLASWLARIICFEGTLPQGGITSGFLLGLVLSHERIPQNIKLNYSSDIAVSVYVDDINISTCKKPTHEDINGVLQVIADSGIFVHNPKKTRVFDLRNQSAPVLGMKITRQVPAGKTSTRLTLSKQKQKQYRAFLHHCVTHPITDEELARARGYFGHILSVYGWVVNMPATLKKVTWLFHKKFNKEKF